MPPQAFPSASLSQTAEMCSALSPMGDFDDVGLHRKLLLDKLRVEQYRKAIFASVAAGDVVLDVGAGSGVLALLCCQAGAHRVYAVERGAMARLIAEVARANGFGDRVVVLPEDVRSITLPGKVDLIVSELMGKALFGEHMVPLLDRCRDRWLAADGIMIPQAAELCLAPVENAAAYRRLLCPPRELWDLDFSPLDHAQLGRMASARFEPGDLLSEGQSAYRYEARGPNRAVVDQTLRFVARRSGELHGFAVWFRAVLAANVSLTNAPPGTGCWDNGFLPLPEAIAVGTGSRIELRLQLPVSADLQLPWRWRTTLQDVSGQQRSFDQSQFSEHAAAVHRGVLSTMPSATPVLSQQGRLKTRILSAVDGTTSIESLIAGLANEETQVAFRGSFGATDAVRQIVLEALRDGTLDQ